MTYPIGLDEISDDFIDNPKEPIIIDTGSKLGVLREYLAFTHNHQCREPIPLQYEHLYQSMELDTLVRSGGVYMHQAYLCLYSLRYIIYTGIQTQRSYTQHLWLTFWM